MAKFSAMEDFTLSHEGGLSRAKTDFAAKSPAPCTFTYNGVTANDWHTNKGIIWPTFKAHAPNPTCEIFFKMPHDVWYKIAKKVFWDYYNLDNFKSQAIANILFASAWGNGLAGSTSLWSRYFQQNFSNGKQVSDYITELLKKTNEAHLFESMRLARLNYMLSIKGSEPNHAGWTRRSNDLKELSKQYLNQSQTAGFDGKSIVALLLLYAAYKAGEKLSNR